MGMFIRFRRPPLQLQPYPTDLPDPNVLPADERRVRFARIERDLFIDGPSASDIRQAGVADCNVISAIAAVAEANPQAIRDAIRDNGDGTFTIRLFDVPPTDGFRQNGDGTFSVPNPDAPPAT